MTSPRDVNAERAMHLRIALEEIVDMAKGDDELFDFLQVARDALHDDDIAIKIAEQDAGHNDPEPS